MDKNRHFLHGKVHDETGFIAILHIFTGSPISEIQYIFTRFAFLLKF